MTSRVPDTFEQPGDDRRGRRALILWGGWEGHQPEAVATLFAEVLRKKGFDVNVSPSLDALLDADVTRDLSLVIPIHTASEITQAQLHALLTLVAAGVGIGGVHGGMCAAFRQATEYHFMTGGQWVAHPGDDGVSYSVRIVDRDHVITRGSPPEFSLTSEQYYMHVDPANHVLATTRFPMPGADGPHLRNGTVDMPVIWTKYYGAGRVFYCSIGHQAQNVRQPEVLRLCTRGLLWAAGAESLAN
jgi:uncharacterized protein